MTRFTTTQPRVTWDHGANRARELGHMPMAPVERATRHYGLWLVMAGAGAGMGYAADDGKLMLAAIICAAIAVTLLVRDWRERR